MKDTTTIVATIAVCQVAHIPQLGLSYGGVYQFLTPSTQTPTLTNNTNNTQFLHFWDCTLPFGDPHTSESIPQWGIPIGECTLPNGKTPLRNAAGSSHWAVYTPSGESPLGNAHSLVGESALGSVHSSVRIPTLVNAFSVGESPLGETNSCSGHTQFLHFEECTLPFGDPHTSECIPQWGIPIGECTLPNGKTPLRNAAGSPHWAVYTPSGESPLGNAHSPVGESALGSVHSPVRIPTLVNAFPVGESPLGKTHSPFASPGESSFKLTGRDGTADAYGMKVQLK
jgi:hypothetical protein